MTEDMYIEKAMYIGNFVILFETTEGEMRTIDFKPMLKEDMGAFISLRNEKAFKNFYLDTNILTWNVNIPKKSDKQINKFDIAPEYIQEHSMPLVLYNGEYHIVVGQQA